MARVPRQALRRRWQVALAPTIALLTACGEKPPATSGDREHSAAAAQSPHGQDFTTRDIDGKTVRLSDYLGKRAVLVNFWATYCQPCLGMFPHLKRIGRAYRDKLVVLAVSMDPPESVANVVPYVERNGLRELTVLLDEDSHVASLFNPKKVEPFVLIYDRRGKLVMQHESFNTGDEISLEEAVKAAVE